MDTNQIIAELEAERSRLDNAIDALRGQSTRPYRKMSAAHRLAISEGRRRKREERESARQPEVLSEPPPAEKRAKGLSRRPHGFWLRELDKAMKGKIKGLSSKEITDLLVKNSGERRAVVGHAVYRAIQSNVLVPDPFHDGLYKYQKP